MAALAARATASGALAARLGDDFLVRVDPFIEADAAGLGATYADDSVRLQVIDLVADAHQATPTVLDVAPPADETIPMVDSVAAPRWATSTSRGTAGPSPSRCRALLTEHAGALDHALAAHAAMVDTLVDPHGWSSPTARPIRATCSSHLTGPC